MKNNLICNIDKDNNTVSIIDSNNGRKSAKTITINDFISSILASKKIKDNNAKVYSNLYSENDNCRVIQTIILDSNTKYYIVQFKPKKIPICIYNTFYDNIGMPGCLFAIKSHNGQYGRGAMVSIKDDLVTNESSIYIYPFSNASDRHICLGGNRIYDIMDDIGVLKFPTRFFSMPNTNCSFHASNNSKGLQYRELVSYLQDKDFENNLLIIDEKYKNYKEWIESLN